MEISEFSSSSHIHSGNVRVFGFATAIYFFFSFSEHWNCISIDVGYCFKTNQPLVKYVISRCFQSPRINYKALRILCYIRNQNANPIKCVFWFLLTFNLLNRMLFFVFFLSIFFSFVGHCLCLSFYCSRVSHSCSIHSLSCL